MPASCSEPASTAAIAAVFGAALLLLPAATPRAVRALVEYQVLINAVILVFNLLPAFPLDGGRVLRSLLWRSSGNASSATGTAARFGRGFGYLMIFLGILEFAGGAPEGLWLSLIGIFVVMAAGQEAGASQIHAVLSGVHASQLMSTPVISIPGWLTLSQATQEYFLPYRYTSFPVVDQRGQAVGLLSVAQIEALTPRQLQECEVSLLADRDPGLIVDGEEDVSRLLERPAFGRAGRAVIVDESDRPVGLISITDVQRALRASRLSTRAGATNANAGTG